jgi:hypothetical protein
VKLAKNYEMENSNKRTISELGHKSHTNNESKSNGKDIIVLLKHIGEGEINKKTEKNKVHSSV